MEKLLTVKMACDTLALSRTTLYRLITRGELPVVRIGGNVRIRQKDIDAFIQSRVDVGLLCKTIGSENVEVRND